MVWHQTAFTTLLFILASMLRNTASKQCGADTYSIYQMMLKGHTFKTFKTRPGSFDCGKACLGDVKCQSYNVVMLKGICELNNRTKEARPGDFVKNKDRYYMEKGSDRVPLGSIPELPADSCKEIKASEGGDSGSAEGDGEYWIDLEGNGNPLKVYCDMKTDGECQNYQTLSDLTRKDSYVMQSLTCDDSLVPGWYRFQGAPGARMPTSCVPMNRCNTAASGWLDGSHPTVAEDNVSRKVCFSFMGSCCMTNTYINIRNCGSYYVYYLQPVPQCDLRYCYTD